MAVVRRGEREEVRREKRGEREGVRGTRRVVRVEAMNEVWEFMAGIVCVVGEVICSVVTEFNGR